MRNEKWERDPKSILYKPHEPKKNALDNAGWSWAPKLSNFNEITGARVRQWRTRLVLRKPFRHVISFGQLGQLGHIRSLGPPLVWRSCREGFGGRRWSCDVWLAIIINIIWVSHNAKYQNGTPKPERRMGRSLTETVNFYAKPCSTFISRERPMY